MKNRISLSGMANDVRRLGRPVRRVLAVFVVACVVVLLLAAGSPPLQAQARTAPEDEQAFHRLVVGQRMINADDLSILTAQNWTEMSDPVRPYVTRLTDGNSLSCGLATQEEMASIRESIDRMPQGLTPSGKHALAPPAANISVNYTGFTPEAQAAFQRAVDIWSSLLIATVPIEIEANFDSLEESDALAAARAATWFCSTTVCAPVGLVNQLVDEDRKPDDPDIETTFSSSDDWYFGLDGRPGEDQHDFVSVALHEIAHGLGFYDSFRIDESTGEAEYGLLGGDDNIPTVFDFFILDTKINRLVDEDEYTNPSTELTDAVTGITLFWVGLKTLTANGGLYPVLLWAPEEYDSGSSVAHLNEYAYPPGKPNALMTPGRSSGQASHEPGPLMLAMLDDMGWTIREQTLQIPQFAVGGGFSSDVVVTNRSSTELAAVAIDVWDPEGNALDGNLILGVGADRFDLPPLGSRTLTLSHDGSGLLTGSITVSSDTPVSAVVRFDFQGTGITGVGTSPRLRAAIAPVRRSGNLSSGVAIRNPELAAQTIDLELKDEDGLVVPGGEASRTIDGGGRIAAFIEQFFPEADTADFKGEISIRARAGQIAVIVLELEVGRAFTTLPVSPIVVPPRPTPPVSATPKNLSIYEPTSFANSRELVVGETVQLAANIEMSDGSVRENVSAEWTSSNTTVARVSNNGLVTARQPGVFSVSVQAEGLTARITGLRVVPRLEPWSRSGTGATILDLPTRITRIRIEGEYTGRVEHFSVWCGSFGDYGGLLVNEIIGTNSSTRYSGVHSALRRYNNRGAPCRELEIGGTGVRWTITEVAPTSGLSLAVSKGSLSADLDAVERAKAQIIP